jgi:iron complex transport system substrate-binding protein
MPPLATRRALLATPLLATTTRAQTTYPLTVTDSANRTVTLPRPPRRLLLATGFHLTALNLLHPEPASLVAAWPTDLPRLAPPLAQSFTTRFPSLATTPTLGPGNIDSLPLETALTAGADLALFAGWHTSNTSSTVMARLASAGIPGLVLDFNANPLANTGPAMRLLGRLIGREEQGEAFAQLHESRRDTIRARLAAHPAPGPKTLLQAYPGRAECCWVAGTTGLGGFLAEAGGQNLGAPLFPSSAGGQLHLEHVITQNPELYIGTGARGLGTLRIGPGIPPAEARAALAETLATPALAGLAATRTRRAHAIWNFFNAVPFNILALEAMARWCRPDLFGDMDPTGTLAELNRRFAAVPLEGSFWISLNPAADGAGG